MTRSPLAVIRPSQFGSMTVVAFGSTRTAGPTIGVSGTTRCLSINGVSAVVPAMVVGNVPRSGSVESSSVSLNDSCSAAPIASSWIDSRMIVVWGEMKPNRALCWASNSCNTWSKVPDGMVNAVSDPR